MMKGLLEKRYLDKKLLPVSVLDLVVLLDNVYRGADHPEVGFEDANKTLPMLAKYLGRSHELVDEGSIESALWSCNLLDENGAFWHPTDKTFDQFVDRMLPNHRFDKKFNLIIPKDKK